MIDKILTNIPEDHVSNYVLVDKVNELVERFNLVEGILIGMDERLDELVKTVKYKECEED